MRWSAPAPSPPTRESFRKKLRAGELNDKEIEIEVQAGGGGMPMFEIPGMPGAQMGAINHRRHLRQARRQPHQDARVTVQDSHDILVNEESDKLLDNEQLVQESIKAVEQNGIVFLDEIDKIAGREGRMRRRRVARGRAARPAAADRGHHRQHQARAGEDRPHPVHRLGRVPHLQAVRPAARTAGPAADPRRAERAHARRHAPHSDRAGSLADQAIRRADEDRRRDARFHRGRHRRHRRHRGGGEFQRSRTSARAACRP